MMDFKTHIHAALDALESKVRITFLAGNQIDYFNSKLKPLYTTFLSSIKLSEYAIGIKFDKRTYGINGSFGAP